MSARGECNCAVSEGLSPVDIARTYPARPICPPCSQAHGPGIDRWSALRIVVCARTTITVLAEGAGASHADQIRVSRCAGRSTASRGMYSTPNSDEPIMRRQADRCASAPDRVAGRRSIERVADPDFLQELQTLEDLAQDPPREVGDRSRQIDLIQPLQRRPRRQAQKVLGIRVPPNQHRARTVRAAGAPRRRARAQRHVLLDLLRVLRVGLAA